MLLNLFLRFCPFPSATLDSQVTTSASRTKESFGSLRQKVRPWEQHLPSLENNDRHTTALQCQSKCSSQEVGHPLLKSGTNLCQESNFWNDMTNLPDRRAVISLLWLSPTPVPAGYVLLGSFQRGTGTVPSDQLTHTCLSLWLEDVINSKRNNSFKLCKTICPTVHFFEYRAS